MHTYHITADPVSGWRVSCHELDHTAHIGGAQRNAIEYVTRLITGHDRIVIDDREETPETMLSVLENDRGSAVPGQRRSQA